MTSSFSLRRAGRPRPPRAWRAVLGSAAAVLLAAVVLGACIPELREPEVRIVSVRLGSVGLQGGVLRVGLSVDNPNSFALQADGLTYDLDLRDPDGERDWIDLAEGRFRDDFRVEANDSATVVIPVEFRFAGVGEIIRSVLAMGTVDYRVRGVVAVTEPIGTEIPYRRSGTVSLLSGDEPDRERPARGGVFQ